MIGRFFTRIAAILWSGARWVLWLVWAVIRPSMRFVSAVLLLAAVIALTADVTRWQVGEPGPIFQSLGHHVASMAPASYAGLARMVGRAVHPGVWDYGLQPFFALPAWLLFAVLGVAIAYAGREPKRVNIFIN